MREDLKIELYRTKAIYDLLKRYQFSEEQKNAIYAAVATAKRDKPNMPLIDKADEILKEVSSDNPATTIRIVSGKAQANEQEHTQVFKSRNSSDKQVEPSLTLKMALSILLSIILYGAFYYNDHRERGHTFQEAQEVCEQEGKTLPLTRGDFVVDHKLIGMPGPFWTADGEIIEPTLMWEKHPPKSPDAKYLTFCVDQNGKKYDPMDLYPAQAF